MNILFIGDIVGKVGRKALIKNLSFVKKKYEIDFVIANGENISRGRGMNENHYNFLIENGVDCITLGNHYKDRDEILKFIDFSSEICRPLNLKEDFLGEGSKIFDVNGVKIRVTNLLGEAFMKIDVSSPYNSLLDLIKNDESDIHIVDFHAESTGEKKAFAYAVKDLVSAVIGTHTHTQTRDAMVMDNGFLFITDVGMCGSYNSVLGAEKESVIDKIIFHNENTHFTYLEDDDMLFSAVVLKFDDLTYKGEDIIPLYIINKKGENHG